MTDEFCGDKKVKLPSCNVAVTPTNRLVGYWDLWSKKPAVYEHTS